MENPDQQNYQSPQPQMPPQQIPPVQPTSPVIQTDPGKTLGIVGFIFAFVGLQLVGLILSIIGFNKSKKAGYKNGLALAGIILNAIFIGLTVIFIALLVASTINSYSEITQRANTSSSQVSATSVVKWSEIYNSDNGTYPTTLAQINKSPSISASPTHLLSEPNDPKVIEFYSCGDSGNKVGYYNYTEKEVLYLYSGEASSAANCTLSKS